MPKVGSAVRIFASNGEVKRQVSSGAVAVGLTDSDDDTEALDLDTIVPVCVNYAATTQRLDALMPLLKEWTE